MLERETTTTNHIAICLRVLCDTPCFKDKTDTGIQISCNIPCFRKDRASTGLMVCALHLALERTVQIQDSRTRQIMRYFDPHALVVNTGFILYTIVSAKRENSTGIDIILRDIRPCLRTPTSLYCARIAGTYLYK